MKKKNKWLKILLIVLGLLLLLGGVIYFIYIKMLKILAVAMICALIILYLKNINFFAKNSGATSIKCVAPEG